MQKDKAPYKQAKEKSGIKKKRLDSVLLHKKHLQKKTQLVFADKCFLCKVKLYLKKVDKAAES